MRLYKINYIVLQIKGNAVKFLNGLTTNTLQASFSAFVNLHGRIITTFRQQLISDDEVLIAVPASVVEILMTHLKMYARISGTTITPTLAKAYVNVDTGDWLLQDEQNIAQVTEEEFTEYRLEHNLPLQGVDYQTDEFILNVDSGQFVSFTKGCFLGQEPVAKVHNRSKPSKKLVVQIGDSALFPEMTSKVIDAKTGKPKGFVFVKNN